MLCRIRRANATQSRVPTLPGMVPVPHYPIIRRKDVGQEQARATAVRPEQPWGAGKADGGHGLRAI